jgi:putative restriction endonuclease
MQRHAKLLNQFRFMLIKQGVTASAEIEAHAAGRRWGPLLASHSPITQSDLSAASTEIAAITQHVFQLVRNAVPRIETRQARIARSSVFSERVRKEYERKCAVSGIAIATPSHLYEVESAHVVPLNQGGTDDIRNGLALSQTIHWAFDRGLFGVMPDRKIYIPRKVRDMPTNEFLHQFSGHTIKEAVTQGLRVHPDAFAWHLDTLVRKWE